MSRELSETKRYYKRTASLIIGIVIKYMEKGFETFVMIMGNVTEILLIQLCLGQTGIE